MTSHVQGDLEKQELHLNPIPMMDRDYKDKLPAMQVLCVDMLILMIKSKEYRMFFEMKLLPG